MEPGIRPGAIPPFEQLGEYVFQELCRDLLKAEVHASEGSEYGTRGQRQFGVDVIAYLPDGTGIEVGQCKCVAQFSDREIDAASTAFLTHWEGRWKKQRVKRFVLFVACELDRTEHHDARLGQKRRFKKRRVTYELWDAVVIRDKLGPHPEIVRRYLHPEGHWAPTICGPDALAHLPAYPGTSGPTGVASALLTSQLDQLAAVVSGETKRQLEEMRTGWKEGRKRRVLQWVTQVRGDSTRWAVLSAEVRAGILRFEASLALLLKEDVARAKELAQYARDLGPTQSDARLRALIALREAGPQAALRELEGESDVESLNLRAGLLLQMGVIAEALDVLGLDGQELGADAETFRLRALAYLLDGRIAQARLAAERALELAPRWEAVRFTAAVINYCSALSPGIPAKAILPWPNPIGWAFVRGDDESLKGLRAAAQVFRDLAGSSEDEGDEKLAFQTWHLACLANDPERQKDAIQWCSRLLTDDPTHYGALAWAAARRLPIETNPSEEALQARIAEGKAETPHVLALVGCYMARGRATDAVALLDRTRALFLGERAGQLWTFWYAQCVAATGNQDEALKALDASGDEPGLHEARTVVLAARAAREGDWSPVVAHLEAAYQETKNARFLLYCCQLKADQGDWMYIADRSASLLAEGGTVVALRLAAVALDECRRHSDCLQLLNEHQHVCPGHALPNDLRRVRLHCQFELGILVPAVAEAEELAAREPSLENLRNLATVYHGVADTRGVARVARQMEADPALGPVEALRLAWWIRSEHQELARTLWRLADRRGLPDEAVGLALQLGFQLGMDDELAPLTARMQRLGDQARVGISRRTIRDLIDLAKAWREEVGRLNDEYRRGNLPVHLLAEQLRVPLADVYHRLLTNNERAPDPLRQPALMARHGGRLLPEALPDKKPDWRLHLDITAVLLAEHLNILDKVEHVFSPLRVPADLPEALTEMRGALGPSQPKALESLREIQRLTDGRMLHAFEPGLPTGREPEGLFEELGEHTGGLLEAAVAAGGYLLDFLPLRKAADPEQIAVVPPEVEYHAVNCRAVLEALWHSGHLSATEYERARAALGGEGTAQPSPVLPVIGRPLFCGLAIAQLLASAGLLPEVCAGFRVNLDNKDLERARHTVIETEEQSRLADWLKTLTDRVSRGLLQGGYETLPRDTPGDSESPVPGLHSPLLRSFLHLAQFEPAPHDVLWADDRWLNSYAQRGCAPIIGINEILQALVGAGALSVQEYYEALARLRAANVRFIPAQEEEILHHLRAARVTDESVVETKPLKALRRYVNACLFGADILQRPPLPEVSPNRQGELHFVLSLNAAAAGALVELWRPGQDHSGARAEWLTQNVYIDHLALLTTTCPPSDLQSARLLMAMSLSRLLSQAMTLEPHRSRDGGGPPAQYMESVFNAVVRPRFDADPELVSATCEALKTMLFSIMPQHTDDLQSRQALALLQRFFLGLPDAVRAVLGQDQDFVGRLGVELRTRSIVGGVHFDHRDFLQALEHVLDSKPASLLLAESGAEVTLEPIAGDAGEAGFRFTHPSVGEQVTVTDDAFHLLSKSATARERALRRHPEWFDCGGKHLDDIVAQIATMPDPKERLEAGLRWRDSSVTLYYQGLTNRLRERRPILGLDLVPPSSEALLRYLRLTPPSCASEAFFESLQASAESLFESEGLQTAIERVMGYPVALPPFLLQSVIELAQSDRAALVPRLVRHATSPISKLHLVRILQLLGEVDPALRRNAQEVANALASLDGQREFEAFAAILKWTNDELGLRGEVRAWPPHVRLAATWAHADRLYACHVSLGAPPEWIRDAFSRMSFRIPIELFEGDKSYWHDVCHPTRVNREAFLLSGLSYALAGAAGESMDAELQSQLRRLAFLEAEGEKWPTIGLLANPQRAPNFLGSFLGQDRSQQVTRLLGEDSEILGRSSLQKLTEVALLRVSERSQDVSGWALLHALIADLPVQDDIAVGLKEVLRRLDLVSLAKGSIWTARMSLRTACAQISHLADQGLRSALEDQLIALASFLSRQETAMDRCAQRTGDSLEELEGTAHDILQAAFNVTVRQGPSPDRTGQFASLLIRLADSWSALIPVWKPLIQAFCDQLPIAHARHFYKVLVRMRAQ